MMEIFAIFLECFLLGLEIPDVLPSSFVSRSHRFSQVPNNLPLFLLCLLLPIFTFTLLFVFILIDILM